MSNAPSVFTIGHSNHTEQHLLELLDNWHVVQQAQEWLANASYALLSVGLTRPYRRLESESALHWLPVNNIHWG